MKKIKSKDPITFSEGVIFALAATLAMLLISFFAKGQEINIGTFDKNDTIIHHKYYTVCYDKAIKESHWSSYYLTMDRLSKVVKRKVCFVPDESIKPLQPKVSNYKIKNYDIGHLTPADDMEFNQQAQDECFYLSNVCPQYFSFNRGTWHALENYVRKLEVINDTVRVVSGVIYNQSSIGLIVPIPDKFYKIINYHGNTEYYLFPNGETDSDISKYKVTFEQLNKLEAWEQ